MRLVCAPLAETDMCPSSGCGVQARALEVKAARQAEHRRARSGKRADPTRPAASPPHGAPPAKRQRTPPATDGQADAPPAAALAPSEQRRGVRKAVAAAGEAASAVKAQAAASARKRGSSRIGFESSTALLPPVGEAPSLHYGAPITEAALRALPAAGHAAEFRTLVINFHFGRGHAKFKVPTFAGAELPLQALFSEVSARGGCLSVTQLKAWRAVVRAPATCFLPFAALSSLCMGRAQALHSQHQFMRVLPDA
jgi:ARID/BRIGHT DNA binding domain